MYIRKVKQHNKSGDKTYLYLCRAYRCKTTGKKKDEVICRLPDNSTKQTISPRHSPHPPRVVKANTTKTNPLMTYQVSCQQCQIKLFSTFIVNGFCQACIAKNHAKAKADAILQLLDC
jgi:hypothetical protein